MHIASKTLMNKIELGVHILGVTLYNLKTKKKKSEKGKYRP